VIALLVDYGAGNLHSIGKALERSGATVRVSDRPARELGGADAIVLPGVGAFGAAAERLGPSLPALREAILGGTPCLGVCLGMQLLLDGSEEGTGAGLGLIPGRVVRLRARRVPHMGWNDVDVARPGDPVLPRAGQFYFANGYVAAPGDQADVLAWTEHDGVRFPAALRRGRAWGVQFHPEKSGAEGLALLDRFVAFARTGSDAAVSP